MHPELVDRFDERLWELMLKVHTGVPRKEIIQEIDFLRAVYRQARAKNIFPLQNRPILTGADR